MISARYFMSSMDIKYNWQISVKRNSDNWISWSIDYNFIDYNRKARLF